MSRFILKEIAYTYDAEAGASEESWTFEAETFGSPGETLPIPTSQMDDSNYVGLPPHRRIKYTQYEPRKFIRWTPAYAIQHRVPIPAYAVDGDFEKIVRCKDFFDDTSSDWGTWLDLDDFVTASTPSPANIWQMVLDPERQSRGAYVVVEDNTSTWHLFYVSNLSTYPTATLILSASAANYSLMVCPSPIFPGTVWVTSSYEAGGLSVLPSYLYTRTSYGGTFTTTTLNSSRYNTPLWYEAAVSGYREYEISNATLSFILQGSPTAQSDSVWYLSTDGGSSFSTTILGVGPRTALACPYDNDTGDNILIFSGAGGLTRRESGGALTVLSADYPLAPHNFVIDQYNRNVMFFMPHGGNTVEHTADGGSTWNPITLPTGSTTSSVLSWIAAWPTDPNYLVLRMRYGTGATATQKGVWWTGNAVSGAPTPTWYYTDIPNSIDTRDMYYLSFAMW